MLVGAGGSKQATTRGSCALHERMRARATSNYVVSGSNRQHGRRARSRALVLVLSMVAVARLRCTQVKSSIREHGRAGLGNGGTRGRRMQQLHTVAGRGRGRKSQFIESIDGTSLSGWAWAEAVLAALRAAQTENGRRRHPGVYGLVIGGRGGGVGDRRSSEGRGRGARRKRIGRGRGFVVLKRRRMAKDKGKEGRA
jgi:hypothetical protein